MTPAIGSNVFRVAGGRTEGASFEREGVPSLTGGGVAVGISPPRVPSSALRSVIEGGFFALSGTVAVGRGDFLV
jgi:hypothetical protein